MSVTQKMFACSGFMFVVILVQFTQAVPVPVPEKVHPAEYGQIVAVRVIQSVGEPEAEVVMEPAAAVVRPVRSASPFFGVFTGGYEKPYKKQHHHHQYHHQQEHHQQEPEPIYHRPQYHKPQHQLQHHGGGSGSQAGSFASAGSFTGGHGGGQSQSSANSQSASFGFGPFQASYSASSAQSGSHSGRRSYDYY
ncbi:Hypothetical protein CINCED_3A009879 [Cinara cedri]|uniref:Uncharacterized protein n=1 Tax=Cinara cedri TaxID=506608 RepID=A0A5E4M6A5_9HEMI|nr:Hypothetical protein CINCED_3A009879 [Cinara cedri]